MLEFLHHPPDERYQNKLITCSATGEANNTEVLWLWWLLEHEIRTWHQNSITGCQIKKNNPNDFTHVRNLQLVFEDYFSPKPGGKKKKSKHVCSNANNFSLLSKWSQEKQTLARQQPLCVYLHIFHGNDVYPTLGSSLHQLRAERVHDNDRFENLSLAPLSVLQQCFCFALIVTDDCWELSCRKRKEKNQTTFTSDSGRSWWQNCL